jgi:hypothetical protein
MVNAPAERSSPLGGPDVLEAGTGAAGLFVDPKVVVPGGTGGGAQDQSGSR